MSGSSRACLFLIVFLSVLPMSSVALAREYHVDPNHGESADSNSGAISQPWKSLYKANSTLQPGDTVYIHEGHYSQRIAPVNSGEASRPIVYQAWKSDNVQLAANPSREACIDLTNRSYVFIERINVRFPGSNYPAYARMVGAQHCRMEDCDFSGSKTAYHGVLLGDYNADRPASYNVFRKVSFQGCSGDLILIRGDAHHNLFQDCHFSDVESWDHHANLMIYGLQPRGKSPCFNVFTNCEFVAHHHSAVNVCCGAHHNLFDKCTLRNADKSGNAMQMAASDNIFRRCLVIRNKGHIGSADTFSLYTARDEFFQEGKYYTFSVSERNRIYNNTFADNLGYVISCNHWPHGEEYPYAIGNNIFLNNIFVYNRLGRDNLELYYNDNSGKIAGDLWSHNLIGTDPLDEVITWENISYTLSEAKRRVDVLTFEGNIQADPLFRNREKDDYRLLPGSPCIDKARPLTQTTSAGSDVSIPVQDSRFFVDGFGIMEGDNIVVGKNQPVQVISVPDDKHLIIAGPISWQASDSVSLPYEGAGPDIGAFEYVP